MTLLLDKKHHSPRGRHNGSARRPPSAVTRSRPPGVLVIAGDLWAGAVMNRGLRREGFHVWLAADGSRGLDLYLGNCGRIDLVLLDGSLAPDDRRQTLAALQQFDPAIRCYQTDAGRRGRGEDGLLEADMPGVVGRPFTLSDVVHLLRRLARGCEFPHGPPRGRAGSPGTMLAVARSPLGSPSL